MNGKTISIGIAAIIVLVGGWYLSSATPAAAPTLAPITETSETPATLPSSGVTITYTDEGFSPKSVSVPVGTTVTFVNQTSNPMWVGSAMHPDHVIYDGTTRAAHCAAGYAGPTPFDQCASGTSYSFTFTKTGEWKYHNHADASAFGSIVVTP